jgi:hypothetical protein
MKCFAPWARAHRGGRVEVLPPGHPEMNQMIGATRCAGVVAVADQHRRNAERAERDQRAQAARPAAIDAVHEHDPCRTPPADDPGGHRAERIGIADLGVRDAECGTGGPVPDGVVQVGLCAGRETSTRSAELARDRVRPHPSDRGDHRAAASPVEPVCAGAHAGRAARERDVAGTDRHDPQATTDEIVVRVEQERGQEPARDWHRDHE